MDGQLNDRRRPTALERVRLARAAVAYLVRYVPQGDSGDAYAIAYRSMDEVEWLPDQARAEIAALAASCWRLGVEPYAEFSSLRTSRKPNVTHTTATETGS